MDPIVFILIIVFIIMIGVGLVANFRLNRSFSASSKYQRYLTKVVTLETIGLVGLIAVLLAA